MLEVPQTQTRPGSSLSNWVKKHSPLMPTKSNEAEVVNKPDNEYDMDCPDNTQNEDDKVGYAFSNSAPNLFVICKFSKIVKQPSCFNLFVRDRKQNIWSKLLSFIFCQFMQFYTRIG